MSDIDLDRPYRLKDILPLAYPGGEMTVSGLRREIAKGNLIVELVAGKQFVTMRAIQEMREKCRGQRKVRASGSARSGSTRTGSGYRTASGSSSMAASTSPQDALNQMLKLQSGRSQSTLSRNTGRRAVNAT